MQQVEFRFLQLIVSHVTGDRVTLGLVHWDGHTLRAAHSFSRLAFCDAARRDLVKRTVVAKMRRAEHDAHKATQGAATRSPSALGLAHLVPVREGLGASIYWSPVQVSHTHDPRAHFEMLKVQTRLEEETRLANSPVTNKELSSQLVDEVQQLEEEAPDRVRLTNKVHHLQNYVTPVSWKNGRWHHALPVSLDGLNESAMAKRVRELVGIAQLCIPLEDVPVPIVVYPESPSLAAIAHEEAETVRQCLADRGVELLTAEHAEGRISLERVVERIRTDVLFHSDHEA